MYSCIFSFHSQAKEGLVRVLRRLCLPQHKALLLTFLIATWYLPAHLCSPPTCHQEAKHKGNLKAVLAYEVASLNRGDLDSLATRSCGAHCTSADTHCTSADTHCGQATGRQNRLPDSSWNKKELFPWLPRLGKHVRQHWKNWGQLQTLFWCVYS